MRTRLAAAAGAATVLLAGSAHARIVHDGGCASGFAQLNGPQRTCIDPQRIVHDARCAGPAVTVSGASQCLASADLMSTTSASIVAAPPPPLVEASTRARIVHPAHHRRHGRHVHRRRRASEIERG